MKTKKDQEQQQLAVGNDTNPTTMPLETTQEDNSPEGIQMRGYQEKVDNRPEALEMQAYQEKINSNDGASSPKKKNTTGIPDNIKGGIEKLSGISLDDVKVFYNSSKPAELGAAAYTEGSNVYIAPGQEEHLPHELWHVIQQKKGGVKTTTEVNGQKMNNDKGLEEEADVMGQNALKEPKEPLEESEQKVLKNPQSLVQRKVVISGSGIENMVEYLTEKGKMDGLSIGVEEACAWMQEYGDFAFDDVDKFLEHAERASSVTGLLRSVFGNGILSRNELAKNEVDYVGSEDIGDQGDLAVNVLDHRGEDKTAQEVTEDSMSATDRGSISVALERRNDPIKDVLKKRGDIELTEEQKKQVREQAAGIPDEYIEIAMNLEKDNIAALENESLLNGELKPEMLNRAMMTIMVVINQPTEGIANLSNRSASYESTAPTGKISPNGPDGYSTLLIPDWFQPFYPMVEKEGPEDIAVKFVGTSTITANYKTNDGHIPVTIDAPDYASEVTPLLDEFNYLATHILTA
jgi:hypothetical protein